MIIGVGGLKNSGKNTVAGYLVKNHGFKEVAFADKLKEACSEAFGFPLEWCWDFEEKEKSRGNRYILTQEAMDIIKKHFDIPSEFKFKPEKCWFDSVREVLQFIGSQYLRDQYDLDIHIKATMDNLEENTDYVISDVRYPNEADAIKYHDGKTWYVIRDLDYEVDSHKSENSVAESDFEVIIDNNGSLEDLYEKIEEMI